jgi:hypothetical protein
MVTRFAAALLALLGLGAPGVSGADHEACPPHCAHAAQADPGCGSGEEHCPSPSLEAVPCCTAAPLAPGAAPERAPLGSTLSHHAAFAPRADGFESASLAVSVDRADACAASAAVRRSVVLRL